MPEQKPNHEEKSVVLRDRIVSRNRSGEGYQKMSAASKGHKNTVASINLKMEEVWNNKYFS
jgi:hypothetical protein